MDPLDEAVIEVLKGDTRRYRDIVEACEGRVRGVVAAMIPDKNRIDDVTQDVFITAYNKLGTYEPGTNLIAWLRTIARNTAQNERRRWYRRRDMEGRYRVSVDEEIDQRIDAILESLPEGLLESLRDCVGRLGDKTQGVVDQFYFKESTIKDLAAVFGMTANAAKVTLHRARHAIGKCMRNKEACEV
jgi:RNA polymerase sigma factor (sigma-70 family)